MAHYKRKRLLIDHKVQLLLLCRVTVYWLVSLALMGALIGVMVGISSASASFDVKLTRFFMSFGPLLIVSLLLLPVVLLDCLKFSHRFAGPIFHLRRELKQLAETGEPKQIKFREGDFWKELATYFNQVANRLGNQAAAADTAAESDESPAIPL